MTDCSRQHHAPCLNLINLCNIFSPQAGDVVIVDFDAARTEGDEGEPILGAKRDNMRVDTETADRDFMPGNAAHALRALRCCSPCLTSLVHVRRGSYLAGAQSELGGLLAHTCCACCCQASWMACWA